MDERTMVDLLEIHDTVDRLYEVEKLLIGNCVGVGPGEGIIGDLEYQYHGGDYASLSASQ